MQIKDNPNYYFIDKPYKPKLICFGCRKVFKRKLLLDIQVDKEEDWSKMICPNCGKAANFIGPKFRAPKSDNVKAWKTIESLHSIGLLNFLGYANNIVLIPESKKGLMALLKEMRSTKEESINRLASGDYSEMNKEYIKSSSDIVKKIDKYLKLKK